jgi:hypothetical protein
MAIPMDEEFLDVAGRHVCLRERAFGWHWERAFMELVDLKFPRIYHGICTSGLIGILDSECKRLDPCRHLNINSAWRSPVLPLH